MEAEKKNSRSVPRWLKKLKRIKYSSQSLRSFGANHSTTRCKWEHAATALAATAKKKKNTQCQISFIN
jgi:hypothetical protein